MYFERKEYLNKLISAEGNGMIKIITGIRRCGKSFLLFNIFRKHLLGRGVAEDHIIQVTPISWRMSSITSFASRAMVWMSA